MFRSQLRFAFIFEKMLFLMIELALRDSDETSFFFELLSEAHFGRDNRINS
jgi:hypothetical protein